MLLTLSARSFISRLDDLDAKTRLVLDAARPDDAPESDLGGAFTEKVWAVSTRLYKSDPFADPDHHRGDADAATP